MTRAASVDGRTLRKVEQGGLKGRQGGLTNLKRVSYGSMQTVAFVEASTRFLTSEPVLQFMDSTIICSGQYRDPAVLL